MGRDATESPAEIPGMVREAFKSTECTPRKRPVILEIGPAVFRAEEEVYLLDAESSTPSSG